MANGVEDGGGRAGGTYLCSEEVADLVEVLGGEDEAAAEILQEGEIGGLVVQREDALDVLPLAPPGRDGRPAVRLGPVDEMLYGEDVLGFEGAVDDPPLAGVALDDAVQPVLDAAGCE